MPKNEIVLDPVDLITVDAVGKPGQRVFYLLGRKGPRTISLIIEKFQLQFLISGGEKFLGEIYSKFPQLKAPTANYREGDMVITPPLDPKFRVGYINLAYNDALDRVCIITSEIPPDTVEETDFLSVRYWCSRTQFVNLSHWGNIVVERGREICPQCLQPMDPSGHFCPKKNGHKKSKKV
jgi:uncharacterized repeat protein (TIGR03847 family)